MWQDNLRKFYMKKFIFVICIFFVCPIFSEEKETTQAERRILRPITIAIFPDFGPGYSSTLYTGYSILENFGLGLEFKFMNPSETTLGAQRDTGGVVLAHQQTNKPVFTFTFDWFFISKLPFYAYLGAGVGQSSRGYNFIEIWSPIDYILDNSSKELSTRYTVTPTNSLHSVVGIGMKWLSSNGLTFNTQIGWKHSPNARERVFVENDFRQFAVGFAPASIERTLLKQSLYSSAYSRYNFVNDIHFVLTVGYSF